MYNPIIDKSSFFFREVVGFFGVIGDDESGEEGDEDCEDSFDDEDLSSKGNVRIVLS